MKSHTDDVSGQIVGGNYVMAWITYDGRKQGKTVYPKNLSEGDSLLSEMLNEMKKDHGDNFKTIWPEQKWKFHFEGL